MVKTKTTSAFVAVWVAAFTLVGVAPAMFSPSSRPEMRFLHPPYDYLRPGVLTFDPSDSAWR